MNKELKDWEIQYLQDDKTELEQPRRIWSIVIPICILLALIGWLLFETFISNMYAGTLMLPPNK